MERPHDKLNQERRRDYAIKTAKSALQSQQDYRPWQRTGRPTGSRQSRHSTSAASNSESRPLSVATARTACSSRCQHSWNKKCVVPPINVEEENQRRKLLIALKMQVKLKEMSLCEYKKVFQKLLAENCKIKQEIAESEENNHSEAKSLLQRYERFRGAIGSLRKQYKYQSMECSQDYRKTEEDILKEVQELQRQKEKLDIAVRTRNNELKTLLNYKEKEYPGKMQNIAKLKRQRDRLRVAHQNELEELLIAISEDKATSLAKEECLNNNVRDVFTEEVILSMNENIKEVGLQNMIMRKEIELHKKEVKLLKSEISHLQAKINSILEEKQDSIHSLPAISRELAVKCLPEDDIHLDIPVKKWLPI